MRRGFVELNGARFAPRGTHVHVDSAAHGAAMSDAEAFADAAAIKAAGFDLVRTAHYPPTRAFLAAAEELGLALWVDLPWYRGGLGADARRWARGAEGALAELLDQNGNSPACLVVGVANEPAMTWHSSFRDVAKLPRVDEAKVAKVVQGFANRVRADAYRLAGLRAFDAGRALVDVYSPSVWAGWYTGSYADYGARWRKERAAHGRSRSALWHVEWGAAAIPGEFRRGRFRRDGATWSTASVRGAARSLDAWTESYQADLAEWHLRFQQTDEQWAGGAHWLWRDVPSPQRCANAGAAKCLNAKGLHARSGARKLAYYVFAARQTACADGPLCRVDAWLSRAAPRDEPKQWVRVYSNCDAASLAVNGKAAGERTRDAAKFPAAGLTWLVDLPRGNNSLVATCACAATGAVATHAAEQRRIYGI